MYEILREEQDWLAINKPAGIGMHTEAKELGLVVQLESQLSQKLWPVHRLDKVTSGVLLLAKNQLSASILSREFSQKRVSKRYIALSSKKPNKKQGWIKGDMEKSRNGSWKLTRQKSNPAITQFVSLYDETCQKRIFLLMPVTGKTHQLRVAMKSLGAPIDGDQRYGGIYAPRTFLHALSLTFKYQGKVESITSLPDSESWPILPPHWLSHQTD